MVELVGNQNSGPEAPSGARKGERGGSKGYVRGGAPARETMEKSRYIRVIEGKESEEMTQPNTSSPRWSEVPFESQKE